jgi:multiple sugar transport system permease protein
LSYRAQLALMLAPFLLGLLIFTVLPALAGLPLAFTDYNALEPPVFNGLANFSELLRDEVFHKSLGNSLIFIALATPLRLVGALGLALLLARRGRGIGAYRAAVYLPTVVPDFAWAIVWLWILNPIYGPFNQFLALFGLPGPAWMVQETSARIAIVIMLSWQIGEGLVVCLAALRDVPRELYEQVAIDGGSAWRTFWGVVLPAIAPVLLVFLFRDTIHSLQANFVASLIVGRGGGPNYATTFLPLYIYTNAFSYLRFGYAAAMTLTLYAITAAVLYLQYRVVVRWRLGFRDVD